MYYYSCLNHNFLNMLEYVKTILKKVSFNDMLFKKELSKSLKWLTDQERNELKKWISRTYGNVYQSVFTKEEVTQDVLQD